MIGPELNVGTRSEQVTESVQLSSSVDVSDALIELTTQTVLLV